MSKTIDIPLVHPFIVNNTLFVYDSNKNCILRFEKKEAEEFMFLYNNGIQLFKKVFKQSELFHLINKGYFLPPKPIIIQHPDYDMIEYLIASRLSHLIIQVTKRCNFKCRYCSFAGTGDYQRQHSETDINEETVKEAINYFHSHSRDSEIINISFYGGEPLINKDIVKKAIEYSRNKFWPQKVHFSITTNGSLLIDEIVNFFEEHDVRLSISLDGPADIQDGHRLFYGSGDGTFDKVMHNCINIQKRHADFFERFVSFVPVVLNNGEKKRVEAFFNESFRVPPNRVSIRKANLRGVDYYNSRSADDGDGLLFDDELNERLNEAIKEPEATFDIWQHSGPCIPGVERLFVSTQGKFYPCEKVPEIDNLIIGDVKNGLDLAKIKGLANIGSLTTKECESCWAKRFCMMCLTSCVDYRKNCLSKQAKTHECMTIIKSADLFLRHKVQSERGK